VASQSSPITAAIIDDDASIRTSFLRLCRVSGISGSAYGSGVEALEALSQGAAPDCLLVDAHMPDMSGAELHEALIASGLNIPTIAITGDGAVLERAALNSDGATAYLEKPFSPDALLATIRRVVDDRRANSTDWPQPS
jgi:two-component system C4-dicarboxylate transport response regulator DctD